MCGCRCGCMSLSLAHARICMHVVEMHGWEHVTSVHFRYGGRSRYLLHVLYCTCYYNPCTEYSTYSIVLHGTKKIKLYRSEVTMSLSRGTPRMHTYTHACLAKTTPPLHLSEYTSMYIWRWYYNEQYLRVQLQFLSSFSSISLTAMEQ